MQSLIMTCPTLCMVCNTIDKDCDEIGVSELYGCIYCPNCLQSGKVKKSILNKIKDTNTIPCLWMDYQKEIPFFRYSQKSITNAKVAIGFDYNLIMPYEEDLSMPLSFGENYAFHRSVLVSNIIKHCDWFYSELINCSNIFGKEKRITISYQELPESFKIRLEECRKKAFDPTIVFIL